jgi:hypothetical protein
VADQNQYWDSVVAHRSSRLSDEQSMAGETNISAETCVDLVDDDLAVYINNNFSSFLKWLRFLSNEDQDLLLAYYTLAKSQRSLAIVHSSTQTIMSHLIRRAAQKLCAHMMWNGRPSVEVMRTILTKSGLEDSI